MIRRSWISICWVLAWAPLTALAEGHPHIAAELLPASLQYSWQQNKPDLGQFGRCAAAFDSKSDPSKMVFSCAVYVKLSSVAQRNAIKHCEEKKLERGIKAPCQLVD
jgi:hypothetical protein